MFWISFFLLIFLTSCGGENLTGGDAFLIVEPPKKSEVSVTTTSHKQENKEFIEYKTRPEIKNITVDLGHIKNHLLADEVHFEWIEELILKQSLLSKKAPQFLPDHQQGIVLPFLKNYFRFLSRAEASSLKLSFDLLHITNNDEYEIVLFDLEEMKVIQKISTLERNDDNSFSTTIDFRKHLSEMSDSSYFVLRWRETNKLNANIKVIDGFEKAEFEVNKKSIFLIRDFISETPEMVLSFDELGDSSSLQSHDQDFWICYPCYQNKFLEQENNILVKINPTKLNLLKKKNTIENGNKNGPSLLLSSFGKFESIDIIFDFKLKNPYVEHYQDFYAPECFSTRNRIAYAYAQEDIFYDILQGMWVREGDHEKSLKEVMIENEGMIFPLAPHRFAFSLENKTARKLSIESKFNLEKKSLNYIGEDFYCRERLVQKNPARQVNATQVLEAQFNYMLHR